MKQLLLICLTVFFCYSSFSQYDQRPSRSRFYNSKFSTFTITPGDILVYDVNKGDSSFNYVVTIKKYGNEINFDYKIPQQDVSGNIVIQPIAVKEAIKYDTLKSSKINLDDKSILWLSKKNFMELGSGKVTTMDLGAGNESFARKTTGTFKINYKGKEKIITVYNVESSNVKSVKTLSVLNLETNPLIVNMVSDWTITLKEVR